MLLLILNKRFLAFSGSNPINNSKSSSSEHSLSGLSSSSTGGGTGTGGGGGAGAFVILPLFIFDRWNKLGKEKKQTSSLKIVWNPVR